MSHHSQYLTATLWSFQIQHSQTCWDLETLGHLWMHSYSLSLHPGDLAGNGCFSEEPRNPETVSHRLHLRVLCSHRHSLHSAALQSKTSWRQLKAPAPSGKLKPASWFPGGILLKHPAAAGQTAVSLSLLLCCILLQLGQTLLPCLEDAVDDASFLNSGFSHL